MVDCWSSLWPSSYATYTRTWSSYDVSDWTTPILTLFTFSDPLLCRDTRVVKNGALWLDCLYYHYFPLWGCRSLYLAERDQSSCSVWGCRYELFFKHFICRYCYRCDHGCGSTRGVHWVGDILLPWKAETCHTYSCALHLSCYSSFGTRSWRYGSIHDWNL